MTAPDSAAAPRFAEGGFIFFPAIDLKDGACVRLTRGAMDSADIYNDNPAAQAKTFREQGATHLHVVDLDGACSGGRRNAPAVEAILAEGGLSLQIGGGIRTAEDAAFWLEKGADRVIFGTAAVKNPEAVREAAASFPGRVIIGVDARGGKAALEGWTEDTDKRVADIIASFAGSPICAVIYTDITRDGVLTGPDFSGTLALAARSPFPLIISGGMATREDVVLAASYADKNIAGVICGRAVYEGKIDVRDALQAVASRA